MVFVEVKLFPVSDLHETTNKLESQVQFKKRRRKKLIIWLLFHPRDDTLVSDLNEIHFIFSGRSLLQAHSVRGLDNSSSIDITGTKMRLFRFWLQYFLMNNRWVSQRSQFLVIHAYTIDGGMVSPFCYYQHNHMALPNNSGHVVGVSAYSILPEEFFLFLLLFL